MNTSRLLSVNQPSQTRAVAALAASGVAWGISVPLSKVALSWLSPGWIVAIRFGLAAAVLLALVDRTALRRALRWPVLAWGAVGLGGSVLVQNAGLARTSVTHAALLIGATPVLVAVVAARLAPQRGPPARLGRLHALAGRRPSRRHWRRRWRQRPG